LRPESRFGHEVRVGHFVWPTIQQVREACASSDDSSLTVSDLATGRHKMWVRFAM
jgi:hypothetical protein